MWGCHGSLESCDLTIGFLRSPLEIDGSEERCSVVSVKVPCGYNGIVGRLSGSLIHHTESLTEHIYSRNLLAGSNWFCCSFYIPAVPFFPVLTHGSDY